MKGFLVYGLVDPRTDALRYIGQTEWPEIREFEHLYSRVHTVTERTDLAAWVIGLKMKKLEPKFVEMEWCPDAQSMNIAEQFWIMYHRDIGTELLNYLDGGAAVTRAVMVAELNGYIAHDGRRWRTETILKKGSVKAIQAAEITPVLGFDCDPDADEFFERDGSRFLNTYAPPTVEPRQGEHTIIDQLLTFLCDGDGKAVTYLTHWIARKVQEPGHRNMTAIVLQGQQGTGKDFLASVVMEMVGRNNCARIGQSAIETSFNAHYAERLLVVADEVVNRENLFDTASTLKQLITDETIMMNQKYAAQRMVTNRLSWIFTSNDTVPVRIEGKDDRRYSVFQNLNPPTVEYKKMLSSCFAKNSFSDDFLNGEVAAFMHDLLDLEVDYELLRRPYENEARKTVIAAGQNSVEAFCDHLGDVGLDGMAKEMNAAAILADGNWMKAGVVRTEKLYAMYKDFCENFNFRPFNNAKFGTELRRVQPGIQRRRMQGEARAGDDKRKDRNERPWVYDGLSVSWSEEESAPENNAAPSGPFKIDLSTRKEDRHLAAAVSSGSIDEMFEKLLNDPDRKK